MKSSSSILFAFILTAATLSAPAANIAFVSDSNDPAVGFFPLGTDYSDSGIVRLLQAAGHHVIRYNQPNAQGTLLTQAEIDALNTNDLIIISRNVGSGAFQTGQGDQWNNEITPPLIDMSAYHVRTDANRLGWFAGVVGPDDTTAPLSGVFTGDAATDAVVEYLFGSEFMSGTNTTLPYNELMDRNTSHILGAPVPGGLVYATATFLQDGNNAPATGNAIVGLPAGTPVRSGANTLAGYRMFFAAGTRESGTAPNTIPLYAGRDNLTPLGERIFLRAVDVAVNSGVAPGPAPIGPIVFTTQPASVTAGQGSNVTLRAAVTGEGPRTLQWQRDAGDGVTFINIPDAVTPFRGASLTLSNISVTDNNAKFRVEATNPNGTVVSSVATLTVVPDAAPPVPLNAATFDGLTVTVLFNEPLDLASAEEEFNYTVEGTPPLLATVRPDRRSVELTLGQALSTPTYPVVITFVADQFGNSMSSPANLTGTAPSFLDAVIGTLNPPGGVLVTGSNTFEISAGGLDMASTSDNLRFLHQTVTGDFDARVRVTSLTGSNRIESTSKAVLSARASTDANAAAVNVILLPSAPGDDAVVANVRPAAGAATNLLGVAKLNGLPNAWLRIQRVGDVFTTYRSTNGTDWVEIGSTNATLGASVLVGMGVVSHRNGYAVTGTFSDFQVGLPSAQPQIVNSRYTGGSFTASFDTRPGVTYVVEYNNDLNTSSWQTLATVPGDGNPYTINDAGPLPSKRFYRVRVQ